MTNYPLISMTQTKIIEENTAQILGLNYYEPRRVKARTSAVNLESPFLPEWFFERILCLAVE